MSKSANPAARLLLPIGSIGVLTTLVLCAACPTDDAECATAADCGDVASDCDTCPDRGDSLCVEGACTERGDDAVSVTATINIVPRQLEVGSVVHVLVSQQTGDGALDCATAFEGDAPASNVNVLAAGFKTLTGGSFHPDVSLGRSPEGRIGVLLIGHDGANGEGAVIATGCETDLEATGETLVVDVINLEGDS